METSRASTPSILRRSCHFCRGRKIRCSGSSICSACQERNIDCVYDVQSGKGRPKGRTSKSTGKKGAAKTVTLSEDQAERQKGANASRSKSNLIMESEAPRGQTIEQALNAMFEDNFAKPGPASANIFQRAISDFPEQARYEQDQYLRTAIPQPRDSQVVNNLAYDGLLSNIRSEMMAMIVTRFGNLGCQFNDINSKLSCLRGLLTDDTPTMLDAPYHGKSPLSGLDPHRVLQLIDTWFSIHPLSPLVSKTLLLTSLKTSTTDEALLAIILADAISAHGTSKLYSGTTNTEEALFHYAISQVRARPAESHKISTVQALVLIGWRELCRMSHKRATCWIGYAGKAVAQLENQVRVGELRNHQRMNGIEVGMVESEIVRNIYWVTFSCNFWTMMQMGAPFPAFVPKLFDVELPPINESYSASISLDMASDNISTLLAQSRSLRDLWPLAHIVCTMTHICALDPRSPVSSNTADTMTWQPRHLHKLRRLLSFDSGIPTVCAKVCAILREAINEVDREIQDGIPKSIVICAYRTVIIQLLFPRSDEEATVATPQLVYDFCQAANGLPQLALAISNATSSSGLMTRDLTPPSPIAETLGLGLDACGRGLVQLHERAFSGSESEYWAVAKEQEQLALYATQLHEISKLDVSRKVSFIRPVKRRLKEAKIAFSTFGGSAYRLERGGSSSGCSHSSGHKRSSTVSSTSTPMAELPSFLPTMDDYSAPNSSTGTPLLEPAQMSYYPSPSLSHIKPYDGSHCSTLDMATFTETMHSRLTEYALPGPADNMPMDNNTWLYMHQSPESLVLSDNRRFYDRPSVTSDPGTAGGIQFTMPFSSMPAEMTQYIRDDTLYWG